MLNAVKINGVRKFVWTTTHYQGVEIKKLRLKIGETLINILDTPTDLKAAGKVSDVIKMLEVRESENGLYAVLPKIQIEAEVNDWKELDWNEVKAAETAAVSRRQPRK